MIPLRDSLPTRRFPIVSVTLIVMNAVIFLMDQLTGGYVVEQRGFYLIRHFEGGLSAHYAMIPANVTDDFSTTWFTIFSSMFLHANWLHIGGNMLYLWIFGNNVEDALGRFRFLLFYLTCGVAAAAAHILSNPLSEIPTVGASGAVAGVMGAYLVLYPHASILALVPVFFISTLMEVPAILVIGYWALIQFLNANWLGGGELSGGGVAYFAHIGGFVAGIIIILMLGGKNLAKPRRRWRDDYYYYR